VSDLATATLPLAVGVLVSGEGTNLQALIDQVHGREARIVGVASNRAGARALVRAGVAGIPTAVFVLEEFADRAERDRALAAWLEALGAELVVLAGYMHLLTPAFLARFPERVLNVHPSLLPAFPGRTPIEDALAAGVATTGVTVHLVDEGVDTGPVLLQEHVAVGYDDSPQGLQKRIHAVEHRLLPEAVRAFAAKRHDRPGKDQGCSGSSAR
jgi:phosphoribosylglycinamide formyltransferase-1